MPDFAYTARNQEGKRVTGTIAAATEREAVSLLSGKSLFPLKVDLQKAREGWGVGGRVSGAVLATFYGQLAGLLRSGVPLLRSLEVLKKQSSNAKLQNMLDDVHTRVEDGSTLAEAMNYHKSAFGELAVSMIRAGGEG